MLQLAIEVQLVPTDDPDAVDLAVSTYLESSIGDSEVRTEAIPEGFMYHRVHRRRIPPRRRFRWDLGAL